MLVPIVAQLWSLPAAASMLAGAINLANSTRKTNKAHVTVCVMGLTAVTIKFNVRAELKQELFRLVTWRGESYMPLPLLPA
jgi:Tfp pilus assembly PilM family ATPase